MSLGIKSFLQTEKEEEQVVLFCLELFLVGCVPQFRPEMVARPGIDGGGVICCVRKATDWAVFEQFLVVDGGRVKANMVWC